MLLSFDTSTLTLSMALLDGERIVEQVALAPPRKQSEMLPGEIGALLHRHGLSLTDLSGIAVGLGPGSFTGLRIGVATAKALGYAARIPVAGASSLAALALEGPEGRVLLPAAVARKGELYVGLYVRRGNALERLEPEQALSVPEVASLLMRHRALAMGPAIGEYREELARHGASEQQLCDMPSFPSAVAVARLTELPESFEPQALFALEPHYVRPSEAERNPAFPPQPGWAPTARIRED